MTILGIETSCDETAVALIEGKDDHLYGSAAGTREDTIAFAQDLDQHTVEGSGSRRVAGANAGAFYPRRGRFARPSRMS